MKKAALLFSLCLLLPILLKPIVQAQETPALPENFFVLEEFVQPADAPAFNQVQQEAVDLWKKLGFEWSIFTYATDASSYYWVLPLENFASMDQLFTKVGELQSKMKEAGFDGSKKFRDLSTTREVVIHWAKDLSYHPNGNGVQTSDNRYCEWTFLFLKAGHETEMAEAIKKYIAFMDEVEEDWEWDLYTVTFGYDTPCWILMDRSESPLAMRQFEATIREKYLDKLGELWNNMQPHLRKMDVTTGWFLPNWSLNFEQ